MYICNKLCKHNHYTVYSVCQSEFDVNGYSNSKPEHPQFNCNIETHSIMVEYKHTLPTGVLNQLFNWFRWRFVSGNLLSYMCTYIYCPLWKYEHKIVLFFVFLFLFFFLHNRQIEFLVN